MFLCLDEADPEDGFNYKQMMARDERRFKMAVRDGDMRANKEEFTAFLHPEEFDYMKDIIVLVRLDNQTYRMPIVCLFNDGQYTLIIHVKFARFSQN